MSIPSILPLSDTQVRKVSQIIDLIGHRYRGWARDAEGLYAVDVLVEGEVARYTGRTLHAALDATLRALAGEEVEA